MKALLLQQVLAAALEELPATTIVVYDNVIQKKAYNALILYLGDRVLQEITKETTDTLKLEDVHTTLNSREVQKMTKAKGDGGEGLNEDQVFSSEADEYDSVDIMMTMSVEELLDWIMDLGGSYHMTYKRDYLFDFKEYDGGNVLLDDDRECRVHGMEGFTVKMQSGKIKVIKGLLVVRSGIRTANCVYTLDGQASNKEEIKGYEAVRRISDWVEDQDGLLYPRYVKGFIGWLASIKQRMLEPVKVKYIYFGYHKGIVGNKLLRLDDVTSEVLQGVKFKVEQLEDHTFEVEPQGNVGHVASSPEVQTQDLMDYYSASDREQHLVHE
ncbi:hypothetical protein Tco_0186329 [Tanacetum coccineum]